MDTPENTQAQEPIQAATPTQEAPGASTQPMGDAHKNTLMGVLAYVGPLIIVSYLVAKDDSFVKFHMRQGAILFAAEIIVWIIGMFMWQLWMILNIVDLGILILAIVGIVNVVQGAEKELPLVGGLSKYFEWL